MVGHKWKWVFQWVSLEAEHQQHGKFSVGCERNFLITVIALVFVILKHSLKRRWEFYLYLGPVPEFLLVNGRWFRKKNFYPDFFICWRIYWPYLVVQVYELITCVQRANENAGNVISGVQFLQRAKRAATLLQSVGGSLCRTIVVYLDELYSLIVKWVRINRYH